MLIQKEASTTTFAGWPPRTIDFLRELAQHNTREWFSDHRADYEAGYVQPARAFVAAMAARLPELGQGLHAEPRIHASILTITRDVRFSADKTPYKTHLDLWFWHGDGPSRERPGYFARITADGLMLGAGMHAFAEPALERYRAAVLAERTGQQLVRIGEDLRGAIGGQTYKRVPRGLPADHPRADWLRYSGLFAQLEQPLPPELFGPRAVDVFLASFVRFKPLVQWLVDLLPAS